MNNDIANLIGIVNHQKGELMFLETLALAMLRSLPSKILSDTLRQFDSEVEMARNALLQKNWSEVLDAFDKHVNILKESWPEKNDSNLNEPL